MANKVVIDVEARFIDRVSSSTRAAKNNMDDLERSTKKTSKAFDELNKKKADPKIGVEDSRFTKAIQKAQSRLDKLGHTRTAALLGVVDNATKKIGDIAATAKRWGSSAFNALVGLAGDEDVYEGINRMGGGLHQLTSKAWRITVGLVDKVTAPVRGLVGKLNSVLGLAGAGISTYGLVIKPVQMQVEYQDLMTQFEVLLGSAGAAKKRIEDLTSFAGETPFTRDELYKASRILEVYTQGDLATPESEGGMKMVGDIAAGTNTDYLSVATWIGRMYSAMKGGRPIGEMAAALQEMGALSAEGRNRLEELAESGEDISTLWPKVTKEFERFDDTMKKQADNLGNLLLGVKSFINNNFLKRIGEGISDELTPFLSRFRTWRSENSDLIAGWADGVEEFARKVSGTALGAVEKLASKVSKVMSSDEFKEADGFWGKAKVLWDEIIAEPLSEWWNGSGKVKIIETANSIGEFLGKGISTAILTLFGIETDIVGEGYDIGASFLEGFQQGFQGEKVAEGIWSGMKTFFANHPFLSLLLGGMAVGKISSYLKTSGLIAAFTGGEMPTTANGLANIISGITSITGSKYGTALGNKVISSLIGTSAAVGGGRLITSGALAGKTLTAGTAAGLGLGAAAGGLMAGATVVSGIGDIQAGYDATDKYDKKYNYTKGGMKLGGVAAGAAIGTAILPGVGTLIGAGIGGAAGWLMSGKVAEKVAGTKSAVEKYTTATQRAAAASEELSENEQKIMQQSLNEHFGKVSLAADEVAKAVEGVVGKKRLERYSEMQSLLTGVEEAFVGIEDASNTHTKDLWYAVTKKEAKLTKDEMKGLKESAKDYHKSTDNYLKESKAASAQAITNLLGTGKQAKEILKDSSKYFDTTSDKLDGLQKDYNEALEKYLSDGKLSIDEKASLDKIRSQIADVMAQLEADKREAEQNALKLKLSGDIDADSFKSIMSEADKKNKELASGVDNEFGQATIGMNEYNKDGTKNLKWMALEGAAYKEKSGIYMSTGKLGMDTMKEKYAGTVDYEWKNGPRGAKIKDSFKIGGEFSSMLKQFEGKTQTELTSMITSISEKSRLGIQSMVESMAPTADQLGLLQTQYESLFSEYKKQGKEIPKELQSSYDKITKFMDEYSFYEALAKGDEAVQKWFKDHPDYEFENGVLVKTDLKNGEEEAGKVKEEYKKIIDEKTAENIEKEIGVDIYGNKEIMNNIEVLTSDFGIEEEKAAYIALMLSGNKEILNHVDVIAEEFGIEPEVMKDVLVKISGAKSIEEKLTIIADELGLPDSVSKQILAYINGDKQINGTVKVGKDEIVPQNSVEKTITGNVGAKKGSVGTVSVSGDELVPQMSVRKTVKVDIKATLGKVINGIGNIAGIVAGIGGGAGKRKVFRGGIISPYDQIPGFSDGGYVRGGSQLITVAEEGDPEAIIPLGLRRRSRALELYDQVGRMLGVDRESPRGYATGGFIGAPEGGSSIREEAPQISSGSSSPSKIQIDVGGVTLQVNASGGQDVLKSLQEQKEQLAEEIAAIFNRAMESQFTNMPATREA